MNNNLKILENELVPVYETDKGIKVVDGRELHQVLRSGQDFSTWVKKRLAECDAVENEDFELLHNSVEQVSGAKHRIYYIIKLDTAKEMAMLERNEKGKEVRKYFIRIEKKYKENREKSEIEKAAFMVKFVADDLNVNSASRLLMYENMCKDYHMPTGFLPKYEHNGSRQMKALSSLLKENDCEFSAVKFNLLLVEQGYLEERERPSSKGDKVKKFKALTDKGLLYGENAVSPHNQKEVQPLYYSDTFMELYDLAIS